MATSIRKSCISGHGHLGCGWEPPWVGASFLISWPSWTDFSTPFSIDICGLDLPSGPQ